MTQNRIRGFIGVKSNDGHDAALVHVAELLRNGGIETIVGGYDLSVSKYVNAALEELPHFLGVSSYNGGHVHFLKLLPDRLATLDFSPIHIIGGGGSTITAEDIGVLSGIYGIDKIFG